MVLVVTWLHDILRGFDDRPRRDALGRFLEALRVEGVNPNRARPYKTRLYASRYSRVLRRSGLTDHRWTGTVSEDPLDDNATPAATRYPYIDWTVDLTEDGNRSCTRHPLNGDDGGVATQYTALDASTSFDNALAFGVSCPCWDVAEVTARVGQIAAGGYQAEG